MATAALLAYPKAGSHWSSTVLFDSDILEQAGVRYDLRAHHDGLAKWAPESARIATGPIYGVTSEEWLVRTGAEDRAVHVGCDPRDAMVSWVFSMTYGQRTDAHVEALRAPLAVLDLRSRLSLAISMCARPMMRTMRSWLAPAPANVHTVSLERLVADPAAEFAAIFTWFGWDVPAAPIERAIERASRHRLRARGDWTAYFDRALGRAYEELEPGALRALGYADSDTWFEALPETIVPPPGERWGEAAMPAAEFERLAAHCAALELAYQQRKRALEEYGRIAAGVS